MENKTRGEIATEQLLEHIRDKGYTIGSKLPNEYELSNMLGVSRNTIREAVRALASRNILEIKQGAGTFISQKMGIADDPLGFSMVEDRQKLVEDLIQIRCIVEPKTAALAAQNASKEERDELGRICDDIEALIKEGKDFTKRDIDFHMQVAMCSGNGVMSNLMPVICQGITLFSKAVSESECNQTIKSHREIYEAINSGRASDAEQAMLFHLLYNKNRFIEEIRLGTIE